MGSRRVIRDLYSDASAVATTVTACVVAVTAPADANHVMHGPSLRCLHHNLVHLSGPARRDDRLLQQVGQQLDLLPAQMRGSRLVYECVSTSTVT